MIWPVSVQEHYCLYVFLVQDPAYLLYTSASSNDEYAGIPLGQLPLLIQSLSHSPGPLKIFAQNERPPWLKVLWTFKRSPPSLYLWLSSGKLVICKNIAPTLNWMQISKDTNALIPPLRLTIWLQDRFKLWIFNNIRHCTHVKTLLPPSGMQIVRLVIRSMEALPHASVTDISSLTARIIKPDLIQLFFLIEVTGWHHLPWNCAPSLDY